MLTTGNVKVDIDAKMIFNHSSVQSSSRRNKVCVNFLHKFKRFVNDESEGTVTSTGISSAPSPLFPQIRLDLTNNELSLDHLISLIDSQLTDPHLSRRIAMTMAEKVIQNARFLVQLRPYLMAVNVVFMENVFFTVPVSEEESTCAICLGDSLKSEMLELPPCSHRFHLRCIGKWLLRHDSCPICRENVFCE